MLLLHAPSPCHIVRTPRIIIHGVHCHVIMSGSVVVVTLENGCHCHSPPLAETPFRAVSGDMSRIQTKAEKEPLMRMQRPSSASSQTTAHVLNSCFGDLLLDCQPVDAERIENLKVTKAGADQFHCAYVAALQKVSPSRRRNRPHS